MSRGHDKIEVEILFHIPKSTPQVSFLTIHLKNIFILLHADLFAGSEICFVVLFKWSIEKNIFLNYKKKYEGGALSIQGLNSEEKFKLDAGEIIIYPSTYLHSVEKVIDGERLVFIGWIESYVKSIEEREYLFDLDAGARSLLAKPVSYTHLTLPTSDLV